jgi:tetratricopeptide (TPR) repeat protein
MNLRWGWLRAAVVCGVVGITGLWSVGDDAANKDKDANVAGVRRALEERPRKDDRVKALYRHYNEQGRLDALFQEYQDKTKQPAAAAVAWMVLGLLEDQRGRYAAAAEAFQQAEQARPNDPFASLYLGQALLDSGQPDRAADALERSLKQLGLLPADRQKAFLDLGRAYQRTRRFDRAQDAWKRMEAAFPNDLRLLRTVAEALEEDGQFEAALARYQALTRHPRAGSDGPAFRLKVARLQAHLGRPDAARAECESLLANLAPDSWLYRETRRELEDVFLRQEDLSGLVAYYRKWLQQHSADIYAFRRLVQLLAQLGRDQEAQELLTEAVKRSPEREDYRLDLVELFLGARDFAAAAKQYEALAERWPNRPHYLRDWGHVLLRDRGRPDADRKNRAAEVWRRMLPAAGGRPDPKAVADVADLCADGDMPAEAEKLYRRAVEESRPRATEYLGRLGAFLHARGRTDEAVKVWREMAAGPNRTLQNLIHLADVLAEHDHTEEAIGVLTETCKAHPKDLGLRLDLARLLHQTRDYAPELEHLDAAETLAGESRDIETVLDARIAAVRAADGLAREADELRAALEKAGDKAPAERWYRLARYAEALTDWPVAVNAAREIRAREAELQATKRLVPVLTNLARLLERASELGQAVVVYQRLVELDRFDRVAHLTRIADLQRQLGNFAEAFRVGKEILDADARGPGAAQAFADLCFQIGQADEGLQALRAAARRSREPELLRALADALGRQNQPQEALELYWELYDRAESVDARLNLVPRLVELAQANNGFDDVLKRLNRNRNDPARSRAAGLSLAQAHMTVKDVVAARVEVERLLADNPDDLVLLRQLVTLAEKGNDLPAIVRFQRRVTQLAPSESPVRLALLLVRAGQVDEGVELWQQHLAKDRSVADKLDAVDDLLALRHAQAALVLLDRLFPDARRSWEVAYRRAVALDTLQRPEDAAKVFGAILDMKLSDDELSVLLEPAVLPGGAAPNPAAASKKTRQKVPKDDLVLQDRVAAAGRFFTEGSHQAPRPEGAFWSPGDFGQARLAALGWLAFYADERAGLDEFVRGRKRLRDANPADPRGWWDWWYLNQAVGNLAECHEAERVLVKNGPFGIHYYFVLNLDERAGGPKLSPTKVTPLPPALLDQMLASYRTVLKRHPELVVDRIFGAAAAELRRGGREPDVERLQRETVAVARDPDLIAELLGHFDKQAPVQGMIDLVKRLEEVLRDPSGPKPWPNTLMQRLSGAADGLTVDGRTADLSQLMDAFLDALRRRWLATRAARRLAATSWPGPPTNAAGYNLSLPSGRQMTFDLVVDMPGPGDHIDAESLQILGNFYVEFQYLGRLNEMFDVVRGRAPKTASPPEEAHERLLLAGMHSWRGEPGKAARELKKAMELAPADPAPAVELVRLYKRAGKSAEALALVEGVPAADPAAVLTREQTVIGLALRTGKYDRARLAAERLFQMRLQDNDRNQLAEQFALLGRPERVEALRNRSATPAAGAPGGLAPTDLMALQNQVESGWGKATDKAALDILEGTPPLFGLNEQDYRYRIRQTALQHLARTGGLRPLVARAEAALKTAPDPLPTLQTLADYHLAQEDVDRLRATFDRIARARPADAGLRLQLVGELTRAGDDAGALEHYLAVVRLQPRMFFQQDVQFREAFRHADQLPRLAEELLRHNAQIVGVAEALQIAEPLLLVAATRPLGLRLVERVLKDISPDELDLLDQALAGLDGNSALAMNQNPNGIVFSEQASAASLWAAPGFRERVRDALFPPQGPAGAAPWGRPAPRRWTSSCGRARSAASCRPWPSSWTSASGSTRAGSGPGRPSAWHGCDWVRSRPPVRSSKRPFTFPGERRTGFSSNSPPRPRTTARCGKCCWIITTALCRAGPRRSACCTPPTTNGWPGWSTCTPLRAGRATRPSSCARPRTPTCRQERGPARKAGGWAGIPRRPPP